jgi:hypothetical protein
MSDNRYHASAPAKLQLPHYWAEECNDAIRTTLGKELRGRLELQPLQQQMIVLLMQLDRDVELDLAWRPSSAS